MEQLDVHLMKIYAACKGIRVKYYENYNLTMAEPMLERIEPYLPGRFDLQLRLMTFFTAQYEFIFRYDVGGFSNIYIEQNGMVHMSFAINSAARIIVYIDEIEAYRSPLQTRQIKTHNCSSEHLYNDTEPITNGTVRSTSCCYGQMYTEH